MPSATDFLKRTRRFLLVSLDRSTLKRRIFPTSEHSSSSCASASMALLRSPWRPDAGVADICTTKCASWG